MSVELYEGCYGVTRGGELAGPFSARWDAAKWEWGDTESDRMWSVAGVRLPMAGEPGTNIITAFPTREAAEAHLQGEPSIDNGSPLRRHAVAERPATPKPVTWPNGVVEMRFGTGLDNITVAGGYITINDGTLQFKATAALQLAALIVAAADYIERNAE